MEDLILEARKLTLELSLMNIKGLPEWFIQDDLLGKNIKHIDLEGALIPALEQNIAREANNRLYDLNSITEWEEFNHIEDDSQELLHEGLELIGALAVRNKKYAIIFQIADDLISSCANLSGIQWRSLTVPAHKEALKRTMSRIIRMRFPEWNTCMRLRLRPQSLPKPLSINMRIKSLT